MDYKTKAKPKATASGVPVFCAHDVIEPIEKLVPNPKNPNNHPAEQITLLARIITATGWRQPITVSSRSGFIVKGHGRLRAAREAGLTEVPVDYQNYATEAEEYADLVADNRIAELAEIDKAMLADVFKDIDPEQIPVDYQNYATEAEEYADLVADNRIAELAEIDKAMLADVFKDIDPEQIPVDLTGYNEAEFKEIAGLFTGVSETDIPEDFKEVEPETLAHKCPRCGFEFDD